MGDEKDNLNEVTIKRETTKGMDYLREEITLKADDPISDLITKAKEALKHERSH